jgi:hypothetical protein
LLVLRAFSRQGDIEVKERVRYERAFSLVSQHRSADIVRRYLLPLNQSLKRLSYVTELVAMSLPFEPFDRAFRAVRLSCQLQP